MSRLVLGYIQRSGVGKQGCCHLFRHTVATLMLENGADIRFIQQMLGHAHISTTEIYTHVSILKLKEVHTLTHPGKLPEVKAEGLHKARPNSDNTEGSQPTAADVLAALEAEAFEDDEPTIESDA